MDELMRMVRETYDRPTPPTATEIAQGRRRLDAVISPKRRMIRARWAVPAVGLAAAATAVAVLATSLGGGSDTATQALSPRQILLAAAQQAARTSVGTYWRVDVVGTSVLPVSGGYNIETREETLDWTSPSIDVTDVHYSLAPRTRPLDLAAWKRAGSPTEWPVPKPPGVHQKPGVPKKSGTIKMGYGTPMTFRYTAATKKHNRALEAKDCAAWRKHHPTTTYYVCTMAATGVGPGQMNWQLGSTLASHPQQIKAAILAAQTSLTPGSAGLFMGGIEFLVDQPMPPAAQAAVYRYLADLPGVRAIGKVKDANGRIGEALSVPAESAHSGPAEFQALFDPNTHHLLGTREVTTSGVVVGSEVLIADGWTNDTPTPPIGGISESSGK